MLLAGLLLLVLPAVAAATPHPIAKPSNTIAPIKPTQTSTPPASPPATPPAPPPSPPVNASPPPPATPPTNTGSTVRNTPVKVTVVVATSEGGRDQSGIAVPAPPPPEPTPLGVVAAGDRVTSPGTSTPPWKIALLAVLAAVEAFLVVRLVRDHPPGDLSPAAQ